VREALPNLLQTINLQTINLKTEPVIHFSQPLWLLAGLLVAASAAFFFWKMEKGRQAQMERFASAHLLGRLTRNISPTRRRLKKWLWLLALCCCFLALARPQYGFRMVEVKRRGIDILFALDTSKSMLTEDIRPNRLERAKLAIMDFVGRLDGDRVGLLPFAGSAFLMCPLTIDYSAFDSSLAAINSAIIPRGGTDIAQAIVQAESSLGDNANHKILIVLTDGENLEGDALVAATKAAEKGMTIFPVGVGTPEGELIPLATSGPGSFVKDESGKLVTSRLDEKGLTAIAEAAGGLYVPLGAHGEGLDRLYQEKLSRIPKKELAEKQHKEPLERSSWPLGAAIVLLMLDFMISGRKSEGSFRLPFIKTAGRRLRKGMSGKVLGLLVLISVLGSHTSHASRGEEAYAKGDFLGAQEFYAQALKKHPDDPRLHYNAGTAAYRNNLLDDAAASFAQALKSDDLGLQEQSYYNLGNTLFKKGEELRQSDPEQTAKLWQQALDAYEGSVKLNPQGKDSQENKALVSKKLEELQKQQEQQKQQGDQDKQQDKDKDKNDQQQQEQQSEQAQQGDQKDDQQGEQENQDGQKDQPDQPEKSDSKSGQQADDVAGDKDESPAPDQKDQDQAGDAQVPRPDKPGDEEQKPQPSDGAAAASDEPEQKEGGVQAGEVGQPGKMTGEEARQLLNRLKDEEGKLNFVPQSVQDKAEKEGSWKDW
jgi:Ca-activated chloride channel homolog